MSPAYDSFDVPVAGGDLRVGRWSHHDTGPLVLAVHGVTSNHLAWSAVAARSRHTVVAPDLRGRGRSAAISGAAGMVAHADDLAAVVDHLGAERVVVVGHSMGGFVATTFHARHPDRVAGMVLVDGGLPLPPPGEGVTADEAIAATIGPAAERLTMTFADVEAYLDFWRQHPALGPYWTPEVAAYFDYDLLGDPPDCRSSVSLQAVREDSLDLGDLGPVGARAAGLPSGTVFLRAERDLLDRPGGLYPADLVARHVETYPQVVVRAVPDVNHYTLVMGPGADIVARAVDEMISEVTP